MARKDPKEPVWDDEHQLVDDAEIAKEFGFETLEVTAIREILEAFYIAHYDDVFAGYKNAKLEISESLHKLEIVRQKILDLTNSLSDRDIANFNKNLGKSIEDLQRFIDRIPHRRRSLQKVAAQLLLSFWTHQKRVEGYSGRQDATLTFDDQGKPLAPCAKFIVDMLKRSKAGLQNVSPSTIKRAKPPAGTTIARPSEIYAFAGDVKLI